MPRAKPWLKLWNEWIHDPKMIQRPLAERGAWALLLSLAQECCANGHLITGGGTPLTLEAIIACLHLSSEADIASFKAMVEYMEDQGSLEWNDKALKIVHFIERQEMAASETPEALRKRQNARRQKLWKTYGIKDSKIPLSLRQLVIKRDRCFCQLCGKKGILPSPDATVVLDPDNNSPFEFDHIVPRAQGGPDTLDNLRLACRKCNRVRHNLSTRVSPPPPPPKDKETYIEEEGEQTRDNIVTNLLQTSAMQSMERKKSSPLQTSKKFEEEKETYLNNVYLTKEEHSKLLEKFGATGTHDRIEALSLYIKSKGKLYRDHYATILNWERMDRKKERATAPRKRVGKLPTTEELEIQAREKGLL